MSGCNVNGLGENVHEGLGDMPSATNSDHDGRYLRLAGGTMSGNIAMGGNDITGAGDITATGTVQANTGFNINSFVDITAFTTTGGGAGDTERHQATSAGKQFRMELKSADSDGSDRVQLLIIGKGGFGLPPTDSHYMQMRWGGTAYELFTTFIAPQTYKPLQLGTHLDQDMLIVNETDITITSDLLVGNGKVSIPIAGGSIVQANDTGDNDTLSLKGKGTGGVAITAGDGGGTGGLVVYDGTATTANNITILPDSISNANSQNLTITAAGNLTLAATGGTISLSDDIVSGTGNWSTTGIITAGEFNTTTFTGNAGALAAIGVASSAAPSFKGLLEVGSDSTYKLPAGLNAGISVDITLDATDIDNDFEFGVASLVRPAGAVTGGNVAGMYGGVIGTVSSTVAGTTTLNGLFYEVSNIGDFSRTLFGNVNFYTNGLNIASTMLSNTSTASGTRVQLFNAGGKFTGKMDGNYNATLNQGKNYGLWAITTDRFTDVGAGATVDSYGIYIDACSDGGHTGTLNSYGLVNANDVPNMINGDLYVGSLTKPTSPLQVGDGTNETSWDTDGIQTMAGTARVWKSDDLVPGTIGHPSTNPPDSNDYQGWVYDLFDDGTEEQVFHKWHVPTDFAAGAASVRGHFGGMVGNENGLKYVTMGFEYYKRVAGQTFDFTTDGPDGGGAVSLTIANGEGNYVWHKSPDGVCVTTGWVAGDVIFFRFFRDVDDTYTATSDHDDDYIGDAWMGIYHLEYLSDKLGEGSI